MSSLGKRSDDAKDSQFAYKMNKTMKSKRPTNDEYPYWLRKKDEVHDGRDLFERDGKTK